MHYSLILRPRFLIAVAITACAINQVGLPAVARADRSDLPPQALSLLPQGSTVEDAQTADLTNSGSVQWIVLYARPLQDSTASGDPIVDDDVAIIDTAPQAWSVMRTVGFTNDVAA